MIKEKLLQQIKGKIEQEEYLPYIRSSEIGGCPLSSALRLKGFKPLVNDKYILLFEVGNAIHINMQSKLKDKLEDIEIRFTDEELGVTGQIDGKIGDTIIEFKTISPFALKKAKKELPYQHHIDQVHLYMYFTKLKKAVIAYIEKLSGEILEYEVEFDKKRWEKIKKKIQLIKKLKDVPLEELKNIPAEKLGIEEWQCKYCFQRINLPSISKRSKTVVSKKQGESKMSAVIEETVEVYTGAYLEKYEETIAKIKELEEKAKKLKEEIAKMEEKRITEEIKRRFPQLNIENLKIYEVKIQWENILEDCKAAILILF